MEKINTSFRVIHLRDYIFLGGTKEALLIRNIILTQRLTSCKKGMKSIRKKVTTHMKWAVLRITSSTQNKCWMAVASLGRCQFELGRLLSGTGRSINLHHPFMLNTTHFYAPPVCGFKSRTDMWKWKVHTHIYVQILSGLFVRHNRAQAWGWLIRHLTPSQPNPQTSPQIRRQECTRNISKFPCYVFCSCLLTCRRIEYQNENKLITMEPHIAVHVGDFYLC